MSQGNPAGVHPSVVRPAAVQARDALRRWGGVRGLEVLREARKVRTGYGPPRINDYPGAHTGVSRRSVYLGCSHTRQPDRRHPPSN